MLAAIGGRTDVVRILTAAGAELCLRGTGTRPSRRNQPSPSLEVTPHLGALLLGSYEPDGRLVYAGRVSSGINTAELQRLSRRLQPLTADKMPLDLPPPRSTRFGSPLALSRVHWVRPDLVAEVRFLARTEDNLLRQVVYEGLREDKPAREVRREMPHAKP